MQVILAKNKKEKSIDMNLREAIEINNKLEKYKWLSNALTNGELYINGFSFKPIEIELKEFCKKNIEKYEKLLNEPYNPTNQD